MKKIDFSKELELEGYYEKLDNGLEIYLIPMEKKDKYFLTYATKFGSTTTNFVPGDSKKEVTVPNGIAHFLEHKMFEQESGEDPFTFFSKSGTDANASTNFEGTRYIATGTKNYQENLRYLIQYVNSPYFTDENVEKEKGIIAQEINMYKDEAECAIENTLRENTYHKDHHRIDIAGDISDIEQITKEDLYLCYNNFYQPRNMFLLVVGKFNMDETLRIIDEELKGLKNRTETVPVVKEVKEVSSVRKKEEVVPFNITVPKIMISIKSPIGNFKNLDPLKLDLYLYIINQVNFGNSSLFKEEVMNDNLITRFYTDMETVNGYRTIYLYAETTKPDELLEKIYKKFDEMEILEEDLIRYKKVLIAQEIKQADYVDSVTSSITNDLIKYNRLIDQPIEIYRGLDIEEARKVLRGIDFKNRAVVTYVPKNMPNYRSVLKNED